MASRSYLFNLSSPPTSFNDRPERVRGLAEWPYAVPFSFRVLMSGDPRLCASLIAHEITDEEQDDESRVFAISSSLSPGLERLKKFCAIVRQIGAETAPGLLAAVAETLAFFGEVGEPFLQLETVELDMMTEEGEQALRASVEREMAQCKAAGAAIDALAADLGQAAVQLRKAVVHTPGKPWWHLWRTSSPLDALSGLVLDDRFDNTRDGSTQYPLGLGEWGGVLYYQLSDRAGGDPQPS